MYFAMLKSKSGQTSYSGRFNVKAKSDGHFDNPESPE